MEKYYWIVHYRIDILSDLHVGAGITLMGGNLHGLRKDEDGFPYLPHTQVRGLIRMGGLKLSGWHPVLKERFKRNFRDKNMEWDSLWSYTSARYKSDVIRGANPLFSDILCQQSHIKSEVGVAANLFSYEKAGGREDEWRRWHGRIYSIEPSDEMDVAFLIAAMRAEDRVGHRRSRGYGAIDWQIEKVQYYEPGAEFRTSDKIMDEWLTLLFKQEVPK